MSAEENQNPEVLLDLIFSPGRSSPMPRSAFPHRALLFPISSPPSQETLSAVEAASGAEMILFNTEKLGDGQPQSGGASEVDAVWTPGFAGALVAASGDWGIVVSWEEYALVASRDPEFIDRLFKELGADQPSMLRAFLDDPDVYTDDGGINDLLSSVGLTDR